MRSPFSVLFERREAITSAHALWESLSRGRLSSAGVVVTESAALQVAAVMSCVHLISRVVSTLPIDIFERVDERTRRPAVTHPVRRLLQAPNGWQTGCEYLQQLVAHILLRGNAYSLIVRGRVTDGSEQITELLPLHPDQVMVEQEAYPSLALRYTWTSRQGVRYPVAAGDMLHVRGLSTDGVLGRSVLEDAREVFGIALAAQQHAATKWGRGGIPDVILRHPKTLSPDAKDSLETHFEAVYGVGADRRRVAVIEEGMELTPLSITERDAQFLETRSFQRGEICGLFLSTPPHLIGDTEKSTSWGTGIEQQFIGWIVVGLQPLIVGLEARLARALLTNRDRFYIKLFVQGLARGDMAARGQWYRIMREIGGFSANDVRALEDLNPIEGGDTYLQPLNLTPVGSTPAPKPGP